MGVFMQEKLNLKLKRGLLILLIIISFFTNLTLTNPAEITEDSIAPVVTIISPVNGSIFELGMDVEYSYTVYDLSSTFVRVRLNGTMVPDTEIFKGLSVGIYELNIEAIDEFGNSGSDEIVFIVKDVAPPEVTIISPFNSSTFELGDKIYYTYRVTDMGEEKMIIYLNGDIVPDNGILPSLEIGTHNLTIIIWDDTLCVAGDQVIFFIQDTVSPQVIIHFPENNSIHELGTEVKVEYDVLDKSNTSVNLLFDNFKINESGIIKNLSVGQHSLRIEANDGFNPLGYLEVFISVVDTTVPEVTILSPINNTYFELGSNVSYNYIVDDLSELTTIVKLNGNLINDTGIINNLIVGEYIISVESMDRYGNSVCKEVNFFIRDTISPIVVIDSPINMSSYEYGTNVEYSYTIFDLSNVSVVIKLNSNLIVDNGTLANLTVGTYTLQIEAIDDSQNKGNCIIMFSIQDTTAPVIVISSPKNNTTYEVGTNITLNYTVFDLSNTTMSMGLNETLIQTNDTIGDLGIGTYTLTIMAKDNFNNTSTEKITFYIVESMSFKAKIRYWLRKVKIFFLCKRNFTDYYHYCCKHFSDLQNIIHHFWIKWRAYFQKIWYKSAF